MPPTKRRPKTKPRKPVVVARAKSAAAPVDVPVPKHYVRLYCDDPPLDTLALLGAETPRYSGGFGGWEVVARPRQVGMTIWQGTEPLELELAIILDGFRKGRRASNGTFANVSQESVLAKLYAVARGDDESPAGIVRVFGLPLAADKWVIDSLELGDAILASNGERVRQSLSLTLREYVPPQYVQLRRHALGGDKGKTTLVTVRKGDTPAKIARKRHCKWTDIRRLNQNTAPPKQPWKANSELKDGTKVRVPVADARDRKAKGSSKSRKHK